MKSPGIQELKSALTSLTPARLHGICLRLAKHKTENKELLAYLVYEDSDPENYIRRVKEEITQLFSAVNKSNPYFAKKGFRKILRITNKHIRFVANKRWETELLIHFCLLMKDSGVPVDNHRVLSNLYNLQRKKILAAIDGLHEDIRFDYEDSLKSL